MKSFLNYEILNISFENCCIAKNKRWFFANELNVLCNTELNSNIINFVAVLPEEGIFTKYLFADIKYHEDKLILVPRDADAIFIYYMENNTFKKIKIKEPAVTSSNLYVEWLKFSCSVMIGNKLYLIPRTYPGIVELNLKTYQIKYFNRWIKEADSFIFENEAFFWSDYVIDGNNIILAAANADYLLKFNTVTGTHKILYVNNANLGFSAIEKLQDGFLLTGRKDGKLKFYKENDVFEDFSNMPEGFKVDKIIGYSKLIRLGSEIYAIPLWANMLLKINEASKKVTCIKNYDIERNNNSEIAVCCSWIENDALYCFDNILKKIDIFTQDGNMDSIELQLSENFPAKIEQYFGSIPQPVICENSFCLLENFLGYVSRKDNPESIQYQNLVGESIFKRFI